MQHFSEEEHMLLETVGRFSREKLAARAEGCEDEARFDAQSWEEMGQLGLTGATVSPQFGGADLRFGLMPALIEILAMGSAPFTACFFVHATIARVLDQSGDPAQKERFLPDLASGRRLAALAITEPDAGSDVTAMRTSAVKEGDSYRVNGQKQFITSGGQAGLYLVFARTADSKDLSGISAFLVDPKWPGFTVGRIEKKMGQAASPTAQIFFEDLMVPAGMRLGEEGAGFAIMAGALNRSRILVGAGSMGIAQAAFNAALAYAKERKQFGKAIVGFQGIRWMLADMATQMEAARRLIEHAALLAEAGRPFVREACMAKLMGSDTAMKVTTDCVQILGGYGYMKDYPVERYMREAKLMQIVEGTNQIQRELIAKDIIK